MKLLVLQGATGETLTDNPIGVVYRLRRSKLRELLSQGLDIQYVTLRYQTQGRSEIWRHYFYVSRTVTTLCELY